MMENELEEDRNEGPPRKRLLTDPNPKKTFVTASPESTVSSDSSSDRFAKKTRDLPNLSDCHGCSVRINYTNPRERLQPLNSMWRVVLLCKKCTTRVKASELCPYCFSVVGDDKDCLKCRDCKHSIHKDCVAKYGSGLGFSVCFDCWVPDAVAKSIRAGKKKNRKNKESCEPSATLPESRVSVDEELGKKASEKAVANTNVACYSRRRDSKKTSMMNSGSLGVPLIFYSRRHSSSKACSNVREYESFSDKHVSVSSSTGLKASNCGGSNAECQETDGVRCVLDRHRFQLKYHRIGKCNSRPSFLVKDSDRGSYVDSADLNTVDMSDTKDFGKGEVSEIVEKNANRFLFKY